jgi:putative transposase
MPPSTKLSISAKGRPTENGIVERFIRTFKEEHFDYTEYESLKDAFGQIKYLFKREYMTERIHSSLAYMTLIEFELVQEIR